jgi:hypothetical protein
MDINDTASAHRNDAVARVIALARHPNTRRAQLDFADVMAGILASTAANVGGTEHLLARRHGSWEAGFVESLVISTVREEELLRYRTEPAVVPLNMAKRVTVASSVAGYVDTWERLVEEQADDETPDEFDRRKGELRSRYATTAFRGFALQFKRATAEAGTALCACVEIVVHADVNSQTEWRREGARQNPTDDEDDPLVWRLWSEAHEEVGARSVESLTSQ